ALPLRLDPDRTGPRNLAVFLLDARVVVVVARARLRLVVAILQAHLLLPRLRLIYILRVVHDAHLRHLGRAAHLDAHRRDWSRRRCDSSGRAPRRSVRCSWSTRPRWRRRDRRPRTEIVLAIGVAEIVHSGEPGDPRAGPGQRRSDAGGLVE